VEDYKNNRNGGGAHGESYAEGAPWSGREGEMSETEFSASVKQSIDDAVDYIDGFIAPARAKATSFYRGDPFGNEEEGRSQIVMTELRDVTQAVIPSLLRIFTASENVVEYMPRNEATVEMAEQATDYVNFIFYNDNPGFQVLHNVFKDALVRKTGIIKWRWSEDLEISEAEYTGLDLGQVAVLESDPEVEIVKIEVEEIIEIDPDPMTGMEQPPIEKLYVRIRRSRPKNRVVIEAVPPEEFLISRDARNLDTAMYVGHRSLKTMSELVAMGYDRKEVEEYAGQGDVFSINTEAQTRNPAILSFMNHADNPDGSLRRVIYVESYVRIDKDGDGIAELRKVCSIGNAHHILHDEVATDVPFCVFCPDPEPHMIIGQSLADQVNDLQVIKSAIVRNTMDSLAQVIHPRTVVVEGQVNLDDVMNTETGAIIRARQPGMVQALSEPFVGQAAMPIIQYMDEIRAQRTGITQASQGLDPDVLQSTTAMAVSATVQGAQERIELIARIFAENGMKRLFRGLLRMVCRHQDHARVLRLRGKWVNVDPRYWDADMDVSVNVAFGHGTDHDRMQFMLMLAQKQEQIMQLLGPSNPLCDISQYRAALAKITELAGIKDVSRYFNNVSQEQAMQMAQQASQNKPPDPNQMLVQIEQQKAQVAQIKAQADVVINQQKLDIQREEAIMQDARERERIQADAMLKAAEIQAKYGSQIDIARLERMFDHDREVILAQIKADSAERQSRLNAQSQQQNVPRQYDPRPI
jgi:hypothetical protein